MANECTCELRNRKWHPHTGKCETCGERFIDKRREADETDVMTKSQNTALREHCDQIIDEGEPDDDGVLWAKTMLTALDTIDHLEERLQVKERLLHDAIENAACEGDQLRERAEKAEREIQMMRDERDQANLAARLSGRHAEKVERERDEAYSRAKFFVDDTHVGLIWSPAGEPLSNLKQMERDFGARVRNGWGALAYDDKGHRLAQVVTVEFRWAAGQIGDDGRVEIEDGYEFTVVECDPVQAEGREGTNEQ